MDVVEIRPGNVERDADLIRSLDTSFETARILEVIADDRSFRLVEKTIQPPLAKTFALDYSVEHEWERIWLAFDGGRAVGVVATQHETWNGRVVIWHLYVNTNHRRRGIARELLDTGWPPLARSERGRRGWRRRT